VRVSLLTGGDDPNYAVPLAAALATRGIQVEFIGNDDMEGSPSLQRENIEYLNLRGNQNSEAPLHSKVARIVRYYENLIRYTLRTESRIFHILWLNKFELVDRTMLNVFYRMNGKKLVLTAHNVNARKRDGRDSWLNRSSLKTMYSLADHVFVHNEKARMELIGEYHMRPSTVSVIPFGLNMYVPDTTLSRNEARAQLGLQRDDRVLLFFGHIAPYKGLDILLEAMKVAGQSENCRLIIAGRVKAGHEAYWRTLRSNVLQDHVWANIVMKEGFISDDEIPILFRATDALVLPYRAIYQSGPLSLAYRFGVPAIAANVGSFESDVISGVTGLLCEPESPQDLARTIHEYFASELYRDIDQTQHRIREIAAERYSWNRITDRIAEVYASI
jgi:D-inositol-3-phosphate glycosyltransferase